MQLELDERTEFRMATVSGKNPKLYAQRKQRFADKATNTEVERNITTILLADDGKRIDKDAVIRRCPVCAKILHDHETDTNFFTCARCGQRLCNSHRSFFSVFFSASRNGNGASAGNNHCTYTCRSCAWKNIALFPLSLILKPLATMNDVPHPTPALDTFRQTARNKPGHNSVSSAPAVSTHAGRNHSPDRQSTTFTTHRPMAAAGNSVALLLASLLTFSGIRHATANPGVLINTDIAQLQKGVIHMENNSYQLRKNAEELLDKAKSLGLDQTSVPCHFLCNRLDRQLSRGLPIEQDDVERLTRLLDRKTQGINEHLLAFRSPGPDDDVSQGEISVLRTLFSNVSVGFSRSLLTRGCQFYSNTGLGKSTLLRRLAQAWASLNLPCILVSQKADMFFYHIPRLFPSALILKAGTDSFYNAFCSVTGDLMAFLSSKQRYFQALYHKWDSASLLSLVFSRFKKESTTGVAPTLSWLHDTIAESSFSRSQFNPLLKPSLLATLSQMNHGALGRTMACKKGLDLRSFLEQRLIAVLDCSKLNDLDTHFFISCLLSDLRTIKESTPQLPDLLVVIDEAGPIISRRWENGQHAPPISEEILRLRGSGIALCLGSHSISVVCANVRANSAVTLVGCLTHGDDIYAASQALGLSTPESRNAIGHLQTGQAILKIAGQSYSDPLLVTWDPPQAFQPFTEQERLDHNKRILSRLPAFVPENFRQPIRVDCAQKPAPSNPDDQTGILQDLAQRPFLNITERASTIKLPSGVTLTYKTLEAALSELQTQGLCNPLLIQASLHGRTSQFWYLTQNGHQSLGSLDKPKRGGTDYAHYFVQRYIENILAVKGIKAEIEPILGAAQVDIGFKCPDRGYRIALQVCVSTFQTEPLSAHEALKAGYDRIIILCCTKPDLVKLANVFTSQVPTPDSRITLCLPCHLREVQSLKDIYDYLELVYEPKKHQKGAKTT